MTPKQKEQWAGKEEFGEWITEEVRQLQQLLDDPQPGLFSWCEMFAESMRNLTNYWQNGWNSVKKAK